MFTSEKGPNGGDFANTELRFTRRGCPTQGCAKGFSTAVGYKYAIRLVRFHTLAFF